MKNIKTFESFFNEDTSQYFELDNNGGSIQGIIHRDRIKIDNWFSKRGLDSRNYDNYIAIPIAFLNNINTNEDVRNSGYGTELYNEFENFCIDNGVKSIILESDSGESQQSGFILDDWYTKIGFELIDAPNGNSIMYKKLEE
jgi:hypothetical protein